MGWGRSKQGQLNEDTRKVEVRSVKKARRAEIGTPRKDTRAAKAWRAIGA